MADSSIIAPSLATLVSLGADVSQGINLFTSSIPSPPSSIFPLDKAISAICKQLGRISESVNGTAPVLTARSFPSKELSALFSAMTADFQELKILLQECTAQPGEGLIKQRWKQLRWIIQESDVQKLRRNLDAYKEILSLALTFSVHIARLSKVSSSTSGINLKIESEINTLRTIGEQLKHPPSTSPPIASKITQVVSRNIGHIESRGARFSTSRVSSAIPAYCDAIATLYANSIVDALKTDGNDHQPYNTGVDTGFDTGQVFRVERSSQMYTVLPAALKSYNIWVDSHQYELVITFRAKWGYSESIQDGYDKPLLTLQIWEREERDPRIWVRRKENCGKPLLLEMRVVGTTGPPAEYPVIGGGDVEAHGREEFKARKLDSVKQLMADLEQKEPWRDYTLHLVRKLGEASKD